jgi:hypothetical protein
VAKQCVFCGGVGLTREHVIPRWLTKVLPEQERWRGQDQAIVHLPQGAQPSTLVLPHREMPEPFNQATVRSVCETCNSGWMNQLEETCRTTITALVGGQPQALDVASATALATWAIKTSLMAQLTSSATSSALEPAYHDLFRDRCPAANAHVWAAAVKSDDWALRIESIGILVGTEDHLPDMEDPPNTLVATLGLGRLLLQAIITTLPSLVCPPLADICDGAVVSLWPDPAPVMLPPARALDSQGAWFVSDSLAMWLTG